MQTRTKIISATLTAAAVLGLAGTGTAVALDKTVTLRVGEQTRQVSGFGLTTTVGDVLRANGVTLEGRDSVSPAVDTAVANGQTVTVTLRRPVLVSVTRDGITSTTLTYATRKYYGAGLEPLDFKTGAEKSRGAINGWVESQTEKRIRDLIPSGGVDDTTRLVLTNAIYLLGDWAQPFKKEAASQATAPTA